MPPLGMTGEGRPGSLNREHYTSMAWTPRNAVIIGAAGSIVNEPAGVGRRHSTMSARA